MQLGSVLQHLTAERSVNNSKGELGFLSYGYCCCDQSQAATPPYCSSSLRKARTRTQTKQGRSLEAGADAEAAEEAAS